MKRCLLGSLLSLALCLSAYAQQALNAQQLQALEANMKKYDQACNANDPVAVAALYTDDAVFVTDQGPVYGREGVQKQYAEWFKVPYHRNHVGTRDLKTIQVFMLGDKPAIATSGEWSETAELQGQPSYQIKGYWMAIDVQDGDTWKIKWMTYNRTAEPAKAEPVAATK
jgi:uncharacterized protein (TIGR02246 family)